MSSQDASQEPKGWFARHRRFLLIGGPLLAVLAALGFYLMTGRYVSTDDAQIQAARVEVSTDVPGRIAEIDVHDNQLVHRGQLLFRLEQNSFLIAVADARAQLAQALRKVQAAQALYRQRQADQASASSTLAYQQRELARESELQAQGISSRAELDQARNSYQAAQQQATAAQAQAAGALADLGADPNAPAETQPVVRQAQAVLNRALLNLSYTIVRAPIDGIVTRVEQIQIGDYVGAASPLFSLMSRTNIWVEANFKETDLTYMRPGQSATFTLDAYPGRSFTGKVMSTSPGTGSSFSLLPPENSSGNWVKVVQRLPVRLSLDPGQADVPLAAGMSVNAEVDTGHRRSLAFWN